MKKDELTKLDMKRADTLAVILTSASYDEAARRLGITYAGLHRRRKEWGLDEILDARKQEAYDIISKGAPKAAQKLVSLVDDRQKGFDASKEVLDRAGVGNSKGPTVAQQFNIGGEMSIEFTK